MPMSVTAILMIAGPALALAFVVGILFLVGLMIADALAGRSSRVAAAKALDGDTITEFDVHAAERRIYLERGFARAFVILGGAFWAIAAFAGLYWYQDSGATAAFLAAGIPLVATLVALIVGWYWERLATVLLTLASFGVVYWGIAYQFELGVWLLVTFALIGPMMTAAVLFWMARRDLEALELVLSRPELAVVPARR